MRRERFCQRDGERRLGPTGLHEHASGVAQQETVGSFGFRESINDGLNRDSGMVPAEPFPEQRTAVIFTACKMPHDDSIRCKRQQLTVARACRYEQRFQERIDGCESLTRSQTRQEVAPATPGRVVQDGNDCKIAAMI